MSGTALASARGPQAWLRLLRRRRRRTRGRVRDAGRRVDLRLVKAFVDEKLGDDRVELVTVLFEQPPRVGVTLLDDAANLFVDGVEETVGDTREARVAIR